LPQLIVSSKVKFHIPYIVQVAERF